MTYNFSSENTCRGQSVIHIERFQWDERNEEHPWRWHSVTPEEAEEVFYIDPYFRRGRDGTRYVYGQTEAGRYLFVVYLDLGGGLIRVISARDMSSRERRLYCGGERYGEDTKIQQ